MSHLIEFKKVSNMVQSNDSDKIARQRQYIKQIALDFVGFVKKLSKDEKKNQHRGYIYSDNGRKIRILRLVSFFSDFNLQTYQKGKEFFVSKNEVISAMI